MDFSVIINAILSNPLAQGMILGQVKTFVQALLQKVDDQELGVKNQAWLQPSLVVLTLLTSAISLALQGQLHTLDLTSAQALILATIQTLIGAHASTATGSQTVTNLANKVKK